MTRSLAILALGAALAVWPAPARAELELSSDEPIVFEGTGEDLRMIARGNAELRYGGSLLTANEIIFRQAEGWASASGNVIITSPALRATADSVRYDVGDNLATARNARFGSPPLHGFAEELRLEEDYLELGSTTMYLGEPNPFSLNVRVRSATYRVDDSVQARHATLRIGRVPVFYVPYYSRRLDAMRTEFSTSAGISSNLGTYATVDTRTPMLPWLSPGVETGYFSRRGFLFGPGADYYFDNDSHFVQGRLHSGYIHDRGNAEQLGTDRLDRPIDRSRGYAEWRHKQRFEENLELTGVVNLWSDSEVTRDFRSRLFNDNQYPDNFLEASYLGTGYTVSAFTRFAPNDFAIVSERLPEVRFDLMPREVGAGVYQRFHAGAAVLREEDPLAAIEARANRADFYYNLNRPFFVTDWLTFTPTIGGRVTHYDRAEGDRSHYTRFLGEIGADLEISAYALHDYRNELWRIDGIRHVAKPKIQYRHVPKADRGRAYIPQIDRRVFTTNLQPLGLGEIRHIDEMDELHTLRYGLDNLIQTRHPEYGSRDLLSLFVANDLRFSRGAEERLVSDVYTEARFTPVYWLTLDFFNRLSPHDPKTREINTGLTLTDAGAWSLRFGSEYLQNELEQYSLFYRLRLNEVYSVGTDIRYDADLNRITRQAYSLAQNLHQTWQIEYQVVFRSGAGREASTSFGVAFTYLAF